jgi:hypothetical protein
MGIQMMFAKANDRLETVEVLAEKAASTCLE